MPPIHRPTETAARVRDRFGADPFRVADALAEGFTPGQLRAARRTGQIEQLRHGVLALPAPLGDDPLRRRALAALLVLGPGAAVRHATAGRLLGLPDRRPGEQIGDIVVSGPSSGRRRAGIHVVEGHPTEADLVEIAGVRSTSIARTALDLALRRPLAEALVVLDAAAARIGPSELLPALGRMPDSRWLGRLRSAVPFVDGRSESPLESASRGLMLEAGLPAPALQRWVPDDTGRLWRVDFLWPLHGLIGEADGWGKYASLEDLRAEKRREDALRRAGWRFVRWTSDEVWRTPHVVIARIAAALDG